MFVIEFLQNFLGDRWLSFFLAVTHLGGEKIYIALLSLYFWLVNPAHGRQLGLVLSLSVISNFLLKDAFALPRPYILDPTVATPEAIATKGSFSFPSGHAQGITTVWGTIAYCQQKNWVWTVAIAIIFLVSLSRVYLGVHFPIDVIVGILLGIIWVSLGFWGNRDAERSAHTLEQKGLVWIAGGMLAIAFSGYASLIGVFCGFFTANVKHHQIPQHWFGKIMLGILGLSLTIMLQVILKRISLLFPEFALVDYARYLAIALWVTEGIPWLWRRIQPVR